MFARMAGPEEGVCLMWLMTSGLSLSAGFAGSAKRAKRSAQKSSGKATLNLLAPAPTMRIPTSGTTLAAAPKSTTFCYEIRTVPGSQSLIRDAPPNTLVLGSHGYVVSNMVI